MSRKALTPRHKGPLFVGYNAPTDGIRRGLLVGGLATAAAAGLAGAATGGFVTPPGPARWDPSKVETWRGRLVMDPYPRLRFLAADGGVQSALIGCPDKCGVALELAAFVDRLVEVSGSAAVRGDHLMITASRSFGWIRLVADQTPPPPPPPGQAIGRLTLEGELMDAKCWLGAMRPGEGLTHKGCAELCVRSGLPLLFVTGGPEKDRRVFIALRPDGSRLDTSVLPFVADPVRVTGEARREDGWLRLGLSSGGIERLTGYSAGALNVSRWPGSPLS